MLEQKEKVFAVFAAFVEAIVPVRACYSREIIYPYKQSLLAAGSDRFYSIGNVTLAYRFRARSRRSPSLHYHFFPAGKTAANGLVRSGV